nr:Rhs family protein [Kibdelosporangium sp. MJ126-NF4]
MTTAAGTITNSYNPNGDLTEVVDALGKRISYEYDNLGRRTAEIEYSDSFPNGVRTEFFFDNASRVVRESYPVTTNKVTGESARRQVCREYDGDGLPSRVVETTGNCPAPGAAPAPGSRVTTHLFDNAGRPLLVREPAGGETRYAYFNTPGLKAGTQDAFATDAPEETVRVTDARGRVFDSSYDRGLLVEQWAYVGAPPARPGQPRAKYQKVAQLSRDPVGRTTRVADAIGRMRDTGWTKDDLASSERCTASFDPCQGNLELSRREYDGKGRVIKQIDGGTRVTDSLYDGEGHVLYRSVGDAATRRTTSFGYDAAGRMVTESTSDAKASFRTENGKAIPVLTGATRTESVSYQLDPAGNTIAETVNDGTRNLVTRYQRDQRGLAVAVTDPRSHTTNGTYDEFRRLTSVVNAPVTVEREGAQPTTARPTTTLGYNAFGELTHVKDANGNVTETVFDEGGRSVETRGAAYTPPGSSQPIVPVTKRRYSPAGDLIAVTDPRGGTTEYEYNYSGKVIKITGPEVNGQRAVSTMEYDAADQLTKSTDPNGVWTRYWYDSLGRMVGYSTGGNGPEFRYDTLGNVKTYLSPTNASTFFEYNVFGDRVSEREDGVKNAIRTDYDLAGRPTRTRDTAGRVTEHDYDLAGRRVTTRQEKPDGTELAKSRVEYDPAGNPAAFIAPSGARTETSIDALGRVTSVKNPESITASAGYDAAGNRVRTTDGMGRDTWTGYNSWNLPETKTEPVTAAHPNLGDRRWTMSYNAGGLPDRTAEPGGVQVNVKYDPAGRMTEAKGAGGGAADATRAFGYDVGGRLTSMGHPSGTQTLGYDPLTGFLTSSTGPAGKTVYTRDEDGKVLTREDASGTSSFTWRGPGELLTASDAVTGQERTYNYDPDTGELNSVTLPNLASTTYRRDDRGRLAAITNKNPSGAVVQETAYGYDLNSNITSKTVTGGAPSGGTYTYDAADRLKTWAPQDGSPAHTYTWDNADNRKTETVGTQKVSDWTYDERNRLTSATVSGQKTDYAYTPRGTLATTTADGRGPPVETKFDALGRMVAHGNLTYTYDSMDRLVSRNSQTFLYPGTQPDPVVAPGEVYARDPHGNVLTAKVGTTTAYPTRDHHGDTTGLLATDTGALLGTTGFTPFGQRSQATGTQGSVGYQGDWTDPDSGKVWMHARWYDPASGSFTSRDTAELGLGQNRYAYGANPLRTIDPTGRSPLDLLDDIMSWLGHQVDEIFDAVEDHADKLLRELDRILNSSAFKWIFRHILLKRALGIVGLISDAIDIYNWIQGQPPGTPLPNYPLPGVGPTPNPNPITTPAPNPPRPPKADPPPPPKPYIIYTNTEYWTKTWTTVEASHTATERIITTTAWSHTTSQTTVYWSNGAWFRSPVVDHGVVGQATEIRIPTVDPERVEAIIGGGTIPEAGGMAGSDAAFGPTAPCGLTGTLLSCLADLLPGAIGGGCAGLTATQRSCTPNEPEPGNPQPVRETTGTGTTPAEQPSGQTGPGGPPTSGPPQASTETDCNSPEDEDTRKLAHRPPQIASELGYSTRQIKDAIHAVKRQPGMLRGGPTRNPDVVIDLNTGEVYVKLQEGGCSEDSIGNIYDYLPE